MKKYLLIIVLGTLLRLILAPISFHSDIAHFDLAGQVISKGYILNLYDYQPSPPFNYPPAVYFSLGVVNALTTSFEGNSFHNNFLYHYPATLNNWQLNLHLLLLKLPYLIFDLGTLWLLLKIFSTEKKRFLAVLLWEFNPIVLYATYLIGQFDIIPVFFVTLALYLATKEKKQFLLSALFLGIGAAFKIYPLFLIMPLASMVESWKKRIMIGLVALIPYLLTILPFLKSHGFRSTALVANQSLKSLYATIPISGGESILIFLAALIFFYLIFFQTKTLLWEKFFITLLLFFIFTHYHPQWFLWLTPFLMFDLIEKGVKNIPAHLLILFSFISLLFFFDSGLTIGLFSPINSGLYNIASLWQLLHISIDYNFARSFLQTIFVGSALYFLYDYFPRRS